MFHTHYFPQLRVAKLSFLIPFALVAEAGEAVVVVQELAIRFSPSILCILMVLHRVFRKNTAFWVHKTMPHLAPCIFDDFFRMRGVGTGIVFLGVFPMLYRGGFPISLIFSSYSKSRLVTKLRLKRTARIVRVLRWPNLPNLN